MRCPPPGSRAPGHRDATGSGGHCAGSALLPRRLIPPGAALQPSPWTQRSASPGHALPATLAPMSAAVSESAWSGSSPPAVRSTGARDSLSRVPPPSCPPQVRRAQYGRPKDPQVQKTATTRKPASRPLRHHAITPSRHHAITPLRHYAFQFASSPQPRYLQIAANSSKTPNHRPMPCAPPPKRCSDGPDPVKPVHPVPSPSCSPQVRRARYGRPQVRRAQHCKKPGQPGNRFPRPHLRPSALSADSVRLCGSVPRWWACSCHAQRCKKPQQPGDRPPGPYALTPYALTPLPPPPLPPSAISPCAALQKAAMSRKPVSASAFCAAASGGIAARVRRRARLYTAGNFQGARRVRVRRALAESSLRKRSA